MSSLALKNEQVVPSVLFGQHVKNEEAETFIMPQWEFEVLGTKIITRMKGRLNDFRLVHQLIRLGVTALDDLKAFLMLEELAILIDEFSDDEKAYDQLRSIYNVFTIQAYSMCRIVTQRI